MRINNWGCGGEKDKLKDITSGEVGVGRPQARRLKVVRDEQRFGPIVAREPEPRVEPALLEQHCRRVLLREKANAVVASLHTTKHSREDHWLTDTSVMSCLNSVRA